MEKFEEIRSEEAKRIKCRIFQFEKYLDFLKDEKYTADIIRIVNQYIYEYEKVKIIPESKDEMDYKISRSYSFKENARMRDEIFENQNIPLLNERFKANFLPNHFYTEELRSDEELIKDLGILYMMFGSTYCTYFNYHTYKLRLKKKFELEGAFSRAKADLYEDDVLICNDILIGFWSYHFGEQFVGDMEWASYTSDAFKKYDNGCSDYLNKILKEMQLIWNSYLGDHRVISEKVRCLAGYILENEEVLEEIHSSSKIHEIETLIDSNSYLYCNRNIENYRISSRRSYDKLDEFLRLSGIVYQVRIDGIYIWDCIKDEFLKLVGYSPYIKQFGGEYILFLMPI